MPASSPRRPAAGRIGQHIRHCFDHGGAAEAVNHRRCDAPAYATRWDEAIQQSRSGNTLGALISMERLMEDPMLDDFDAEHRGRAAQVAGWTA
jgi:hypothetical protein